jgi:hypothetical protein
MLEDRRIARAFAQGEYRPLAPIRELYRTQVVVDEARFFARASERLPQDVMR